MSANILVMSLQLRLNSCSVWCSMCRFIHRRMKMPQLLLRDDKVLVYRIAAIDFMRIVPCCSTCHITVQEVRNSMLIKTGDVQYGDRLSRRQLQQDLLPIADVAEGVISKKHQNQRRLTHSSVYESQSMFNVASTI